MKIVTITGTGSLVSFGVCETAVHVAAAAVRLRAADAGQPAGYGVAPACRHHVQHPVAPIGTDMPVSGRTRVSAPMP